MKLLDNPAETKLVGCGAIRALQILGEFTQLVKLLVRSALLNRLLFAFVAATRRIVVRAVVTAKG
jgi:hypothetical protein